MAVKHAVLGLLVERRSYGGELVARLEDRLGPGLASQSSTVYSAIDALEREGYVEVTKTTMRGKQKRIYYGPTPTGAEHFESWLDEPVAREPMRGELYLKLAMVDLARVPMLCETFEHLELEVLTDIARHTRAQRLADEPVDPVPLATTFRWLFDSRVLDHLNGELSFVKRTLQVLRCIQEAGELPRSTLLEAVSSSS